MPEVRGLGGWGCAGWAALSQASRWDLEVLLPEPRGFSLSNPCCVIPREQPPP